MLWVLPLFKTRVKTREFIAHKPMSTVVKYVQNYCKIRGTIMWHLVNNNNNSVHKIIEEFRDGVNVAFLR